MIMEYFKFSSLPKVSSTSQALQRKQHVGPVMLQAAAAGNNTDESSETQSNELNQNNALKDAKKPSRAEQNC